MCESVKYQNISLGDWSAWAQCSATCKVYGGSDPTQTRSRSCTGACTGKVLGGSQDCNEGTTCPSMVFLLSWLVKASSVFSEPLLLFSNQDATILMGVILMSVIQKFKIVIRY